MKMKIIVFTVLLPFHFYQKLNNTGINKGLLCKFQKRDLRKNDVDDNNIWYDKGNYYFLIFDS